MLKFLGVFVGVTFVGMVWAEAESYYPLLTEPNFAETSITQSYFDQPPITNRVRSLKSIDTDGFNVSPIIDGFVSDTPVETISIVPASDFLDAFSTISYTHRSVNDGGAVQYQTTSGVLTNGNPLDPVPGNFEFNGKTRYYAVGFDGQVGDLGVQLIPRKATIGTITETRYRSVSSSRTDTGAGFALISDDTRDIRLRQVYAGVGEVPSLYPGSSQLATGSFTALVSITEQTLSGVSKSWTDDGTTVTYQGETTIDETTSTSIEWIVKGIGSIRLLLVSDSWMDLILSESVFNDGSNVVGAIDLDTLISPDYRLVEVLRASGGDLSEATNTVLTKTAQVIELWGKSNEVPLSFETYAANAGLTGADASAEAMPFGDGISNWVKYAFKIPLNVRYGIDSGAGVGLPVLRIDGSVLRLEYIQRKNAGLVYTPMISSTLAADDFTPLEGERIVSEIGNGFERVVVESTLGPNRFAYVKVTAL